MSDESHCCAVCGLSAERCCSGCKSVFYCSTDHSVTNWSQHKAVCTRRTPEGGAKSASVAPHIRGIFFPVDSDAPVYIDIPYRVHVNGLLDEGAIQHKIDFTPWFGDKSVSGITVATQGVGGPSIGRRIHFFFNDNFMADGDPLNQCVQKITGGTPNPWGGNMLAVRAMDAELFVSDMVRDTSPKDLAYLVTYLKEYGATQRKPQCPMCEEAFDKCRCKPALTYFNLGGNA